MSSLFPAGAGAHGGPFAYPARIAGPVASGRRRARVLAPSAAVNASFANGRSVMERDVPAQTLAPKHGCVDEDQLAPVGPRPSTDGAAVNAAHRVLEAVVAQDALPLKESAERAAWPGGPSIESITEHLDAVREARARRARGQDVPTLPPLSIDRAREMDAARDTRSPALRR